MKDFTERIAARSPEQRALFAAKLKERAGRVRHAYRLICSDVLLVDADRSRLRIERLVRRPPAQEDVVYSLFLMLRVSQIPLSNNSGVMLYVADQEIADRAHGHRMRHNVARPSTLFIRQVLK